MLIIQGNPECINPCEVLTLFVIRFNPFIKKFKYRSNGNKKRFG